MLDPDKLVKLLTTKDASTVVADIVTFGGTVDLDVDEDGQIVVRDARRRDGTPAAQGDKETIGALFKWGNPAAYDRILGERINVDDAIGWRPAGS